MVAQPINSPKASNSSPPQQSISAAPIDDSIETVAELTATTGKPSNVTNSNHSQQQYVQLQHHQYISKKDRLIATSTSKTNLYIKGLDENTTDKDLYDLCERFGDIKSTKAIVDKVTNKCKGYGFVDFKSQEDARRALAELKKEQRDVQLAKQREQDPTNLYFANLPLDIDEDMLNNMLKVKFGAVVSSTRIMREKTGNSKGVGFARIDDEKLCDKIIQELNNQPFPEHINTDKFIMVKLADSCSVIKPPPPPPPALAFSSSTNKFYRHGGTDGSYHHHQQQHHSSSGNNCFTTATESLQSSNSGSLHNGTAAASSSSLLVLNDNNNNQYGMSNLNLSNVGAAATGSGHHGHQTNSAYRHQQQHAAAVAAAAAYAHIYGHHFNHHPYIDYNNYSYTIMMDQSGGYIGQQHQGYAPVLGGTHANIPLLQTPANYTSATTNTPNTTALLPQPLVSASLVPPPQHHQPTGAMTASASSSISAPTTTTATTTMSSPVYATTAAASSSSSSSSNNSHRSQQQSYAQASFAGHAFHQPHYFTTAAAAQPPGALANSHLQHTNQISHQIPYYFYPNPYHQAVAYHQQTNTSTTTTAAHIAAPQTQQAHSYHHMANASQTINSSNNSGIQQQSTASASNTPSSTPISQSSSLAQNMSNLSISSTSTSKPI